jgi:N,N'-diacetylchitobiose transport system permease protein
MIPLNALIIPITSFSPRRTRSQAERRDLTYPTFVLPFTIWTLRGFMLGVPRISRRPRGRRHHRFGAFLRILLPLIGPGLVATSIFAFIRPGTIHHGLRLAPRSEQADAHRLARVVYGDRGTASGPADGGATLTALPCVIFFVAVQRKIAFRLTLARSRMNGGRLEPAAAACLFPGFDGVTAPDWLRRSLAAGSAASCCSRATSATRSSSPG